MIDTEALGILTGTILSIWRAGIVDFTLNNRPMMRADGKAYAYCHGGRSVIADQTR